MTPPSRLTPALTHVLAALMPHTEPAPPACAKDIACAAAHPINTVTGILARLESHGIVTGEWKSQRRTRPIRYYTLTPDGITYIRTHRATPTTTGAPHA